MTRAAALLWTLSAIGGAIAAVGLLSSGAYLVIPFLVLLLVAIRSSQLRTTVGGVLVGFGSVAAFAFIASYIRCGGAGEGQAVCVAQNVLPPLVLAVLALFAGISLTWLPRRPRPSG